MRAIIISVNHSTGISQALGEDCQRYKLYSSAERKDFKTTLEPGQVVEIEPEAEQQLLSFTTTGRQIAFSKDGQGLPVESSPFARALWQALATAMSSDTERPLTAQGMRGYKVKGLM